jgi:iron complex transport system permease protein
VKKNIWIPCLIFLLTFTILLSLTLGKFEITLSEIFDFFATAAGIGSLDREKYELLSNILLDIRLPRIIAAALIGSALSVSGAAFQSMFINPLVSPGLLGVLAGASFGAALGMIASDSWFAVQSGAFLCGFAAVLIAIGIARLYRGDRLLMLILGGIISGALFTSLLSIVKYVADPYDQLPAIVYWLMGGLSLADGKTVGLVSLPIGAGILGLLFFSRYLNILSMGDDEAKSLGINVSRLRMLLIFLATLISALTVVIGGLIGWVGLIIPHVARMLVGPDNRMLMPVAALIGAIYLVAVDDVARLIFTVEIPLGIVTSLMGIPFFILVLKNARKGWA